MGSKAGSMYIYHVYIYIYERWTSSILILREYGKIAISAQELNAALEEFALGKSMVTQRRDIVLGRHCAP